MDATKALNDVLDANEKIKYNEAADLLLRKYKVSLSRSNYDKIKSVRRKGKKKSLPGKKKVSKTPKSIPPQDTHQEHDFIDDPDELLMSVAVRELNRPNPDPRWANVLITTRRENIGISKKEGIIQSKFKSMSISEVSKILARKRENISLKPDLKESS